MMPTRPSTPLNDKLATMSRDARRIINYMLVHYAKTMCRRMRERGDYLVPGVEKAMETLEKMYDDGTIRFVEVDDQLGMELWSSSEQKYLPF